MSPYSQYFGKLHNGEPRNAMLFTGILVLAALLLGDLNAIAQVLTMFFLLTYFTINSVLLIEQRINLISFRPTLKIPQWIPFSGAVACLVAIVIISPFWGMVALSISISIYFYLTRRNLEYPWETVRSGLFAAIANWAAKKVVTEEETSLRAWKPDILFPIERRTQLEGHYRLLRSLMHPQGSVQVIALMKERDILPLLGLKQIIKNMHQEGMFASSAIVDSVEYLSSLETAVAVTRSSFFAPNTFFIPVDGRAQSELQGIMEIAEKNKMGVIFYAAHAEAQLGREKTINLWIRDQSPEWQLSIHLANLDLSLLLGYKLLQNWDANMRVVTVVNTQEYIEGARTYLRDLMSTARIPKQCEILVQHCGFNEFLGRVPRADLNIFGLSNIVNKTFMEAVVNDTKSSCIFVKTSGRESALA